MKRIKFVLVRAMMGSWPYLEVEPKNVQWIDVNLPVTYRVMSNKEWGVK